MCVVYYTKNKEILVSLTVNFYKGEISMKKHKTLALALSIAMAASLAGCGTGSFSSSSTEAGSADSATTAASDSAGTAQTEKSDDASADSSSNAEASEYTGESYEFQLGHIGNDGSNEDLVAKKFAELVDQKSGGKIKITIFGNAQMGGLTDLVDAIRYDTIDFAFFATGNLESYDTIGTILGLPYLFSGYDHVEAFYQTDTWKKITDQLAEETNALDLADFHSGFRDILSNVEINNADDMKGLEIRIPEAPSFVKSFGALGCNTTTLAASEVYQALQTGLVEATEAAPVYMESMNYHEVTKYCIRTNHMYTGNSVFMSQKKFDSLSEDAQNIIRESAQEAAAITYDSVEESDEEAFKVFEEKGLQIIDPDLDSFKSAMTDVWNELYISVVPDGQAIVDEVLSIDPEK